MRSEDLRELLDLVARQKSVALDNNNIFDPPGRAYLTLKTMFQNYKKEHELQIMQSRIFDIKVDQSGRNASLKRVSADCLFRYHSLSEQDILLLIEIKEHLQQDSKQELYQSILNGIAEQPEVSSFMKCYRTLLNHQFYKHSPRYHLIEGKMIDKLLSLPSLTSKDVKLITHHLVGLPKISHHILTLISKLYEKVTKLNDYRPLFLIFKTNFPEEPRYEDIQSLVRICLPETLAKFKELLGSRPDLKPSLLRAAEEEAKNKLKQMELGKTSKTVAILNFIVETVNLGIPIWQEIIEWEHMARQQPKNILKNSLESILARMLNDFKSLGTVIEIVRKITEIDQHSEIGLIFVRELLKLQNRDFLSHRVIRKFLAIKILKYNSSEEYLKQILDNNFNFIEVILEMFSYRANVLNFYQHLLNSQHLPLFQTYLARLAAELPLKFKDFFLKCLEVDAEKGELLGNSSSALLKMLCELVGGEIGASLVKDLSVSGPSKNLLLVLIRLLTGLRDGKQLQLVKVNVVRALNTMLIRTPKGEINKTFQLQLPVFIKEYIFEKREQIFLNVPQETSEELKKTYDSFRLRSA